MTDTKEFPPISNGNCDGLGCGEKICHCNEHTAMAEEYQRKYHKQWDHNSPECKIFEDGWRVGSKFIRIANELHDKLSGYELREHKWNSDRYLWLRSHAFLIEPTQVTSVLALSRGKYSQLHRDPKKIIDHLIMEEVLREEKQAKKANQTPN